MNQLINDQNPLLPLKIKELKMSIAFKNALENLPRVGDIKILHNGFSYVDIDDGFIYELQPLLPYTDAVKPDYFEDEAYHIGAHISLTYPEENTYISEKEANKRVEFKIIGLFTADLDNKNYFVLGVDSPDLIAIRHRYGLKPKLQLKGYSIDPHITIAVIENNLILPKAAH